jgi:hypothetical protein
MDIIQHYPTITDVHQWNSQRSFASHFVARLAQRRGGIFGTLTLGRGLRGLRPTLQPCARMALIKVEIYRNLSHVSTYFNCVIYFNYLFPWYWRFMFFDLFAIEFLFAYLIFVCRTLHGHQLFSNWYSPKRFPMFDVVIHPIMDFLVVKYYGY